MARYDLATRTLELVNVPSESLDEQAIAALVERTVPLELVHRHGETLLFCAPRAGNPLVVLAGHLDTVPANGNLPGRIADGAVHGLGASDMKGGLAVMVELARWIADERPSLTADVAFLFFPREELPASESALPETLATGLIDDAALVIVLEPTDNTIQVGCLGNVNAKLRFDGVSAHSARPWTGVNAIAVAVEALLAIVRLEPRDVDVGGFVFREVVSVTRIEGGIAQNVIPDRAECSLNFRYAPSRTPEEARALLTDLVGSAGTLTIVSESPPAHVAAETPLVRRLRAAGEFAVEPKQAWTPVAEFAAHGLDAVNLGPGATRYAHRGDEQVETAALTRTFESLQRFLVAGSP